MSARARLARLAVRVYPRAWRRRYGEELLALLEQRPPRARDALDLLRGAARAHLRSSATLDALVSPAEHMRDSIGAIALCWGVLALAGAGFAKSTEDQVFDQAGHAHPLLGALHGAVTGFAFAAALVLAVAGAPLLVWILRVAWHERRRELVVALGVLPGALGLFVAVTAVLVAVRGGGLPHAVVLAWLALGIGVGLVWAAAPGVVLARLDAPPSLLAWAMRFSAALVALMIAIAVSAAGYAVALAASAPAVGAGNGGPLFTSTNEALAVQSVALVAAAAAATLSARRGRRALRAR